jgi:CHAT domain
MGYVDCEYHLMGVKNHLWARFHSVCIDCDGPVALKEADLAALGELAFDPEAYGQGLFAHLFPPGSDLLLGFRETKVFLAAKGEGMRFRVYIAPSVLNGVRELAWERVHDGDGVLAFSPTVAFSRYLAVRAPLGAALAGQPRLLVAIAAPPDLPGLGLAPIDLEGTYDALDKCFQAHLQGRIDYEFFAGHVTPGDLLQRLRDGAFHALHLVAHGLPPRYQGAGLVLQHANGLANPVPEQGVASIFLGNPDLRLATLVACHGGATAQNDPFHGLAGRLVRLGVPAVVAMSREISFAAAELFSQHLYRSLAVTGQVDIAVNAARHQLSLTTDEWDVPLLFMRLRDGRLWQVQRRERWIAVLMAAVLCLLVGALLWKGGPSLPTGGWIGSVETRSSTGGSEAETGQGDSSGGLGGPASAGIPVAEGLKERLAEAEAHCTAGGKEQVEQCVQKYQEILASLAPRVRSSLDPQLLTLAAEQRRQGSTSEAARLYKQLFSGLEGPGPETNSPEQED